jgi:exodeoxyribonuclease VII small subunit
VTKAAKSYREMTTELDEILLWFESGDVDLDEAVAKYEEAAQLIEQMEKYLKSAENKIRKITVGKK